MKNYFRKRYASEPENQHQIKAGGALFGKVAEVARGTDERGRIAVGF